MGATSIQELNGYVHRSVDVVLGLSNYILAALMVAFGAVQLIYAYTDEYTTLTWLLALSYIVMLVGGAVITSEYAEKIGADIYAKDAVAAVRAADGVFAK